MKSHPIVRVVGMVLILSALVSVASWGGSPTTLGARASNLQTPHTLDVGVSRSLQKMAAISLPQQYIEHEPIHITKNSEFAAFGFPGAGTPSNPYVIEGLNITRATKNLINIDNTTAYFSIRNNLLNGLTGEHDGIYLKHVTHGSIDSNIISNCKNGIYLKDSGGAIAHNTISHCEESGIGLDDSRGSIVHNTISHCGRDGIDLWNSSGGAIAHNTISHCGRDGINLGLSSGESIDYNTISHCGRNGIDLWFRVGSIDYNTISHCGRDGIRLSDSARSVDHNTISHCGWAGIRLGDSINTLVGNRLVNNGLVVSHSSNLGTVAENVVKDRPLVYWENVRGGTVPPGAGQIILINTTGVEVTGQNLSWASTGVIAAHSSNLNIHHNTLSGVYLGWSENNTVTHNTVSQSTGVGGIYLVESRGNIVANNTVAQSSNGIYLSRSEQNTVNHNIVFQSNENGIIIRNSMYNTLTNNTISQNSNGIVLEDSGQHTVAYNTVAECEVGIQLTYSNQNIMSHNTVSNCRKGIYLYETRQNTLVGNQLVNNGLVIEIYLPDRGLYPSPQIWPVEHYVQETVVENVVNGRPLVFWQNVRGGTVPPGAGQVILLNSTGVEVTGQDLVQVPTGVLAVYCSHLTIHHNTVSECGEEGIALYDSGNSTVAHNSIVQCGTGIKLHDADQNTLVDNTLSQCEAGIVLTATSGQNTLVGNQLVDNDLVIINLYFSDRFGLCVRPVEFYLQATVAGNVVNGRPLVFWQHVRGGTVPPGAGQIFLLNCTGVEVTGQTLASVSTGVFAAGCSHLAIHHNSISNNSLYGIYVHVSGNSTIANNTISECEVGIRLFDSDNTTIAYNTVTQTRVAGISLVGVTRGIPYPRNNNTVVYNTVTNNYDTGISLTASWQNTVAHNIVFDCGAGIKLYLSNNQNTVTHNTMSECEAGIALYHSDSNTVAYNTVSECEAGIKLDNAEQNTVAHNTLSQNRGYGIALTDPDYNEDNTVMGNDFLGNHPGGHSQAYDEGSDNIFARNYWDDHDNMDWNDDGIADIPYAIDGGASNQDLSPLTVLVDLSHHLSAPIIAYPYGGETLQGTVMLHWTPTSDLWGHSVTYAVLYSTDDGQTWIPLASGLSTSEYEWDTTTVADGSAYRVQVVATCSEGLTAEDRSDTPFTIQNLAAITTVGTFPLPGMPGAMLLVTFLLLLAMHADRRDKRQVR